MNGIERRHIEISLERIADSLARLVRIIDNKLVFKQDFRLFCYATLLLATLQLSALWLLFGLSGHLEVVVEQLEVVEERLRAVEERLRAVEERLKKAVEERLKKAVDERLRAVDEGERPKADDCLRVDKCVDERLEEIRGKLEASPPVNP